MKPVSILIANYAGHEALELCVESILARTRYGPGFQIVVWNSPADGKDEAYLRAQENAGWLVYYQADRDYDHGQAVAQLLRLCEREWACIIDSDCEILNGSWLYALGKRMTTSDTFGVATYRPGIIEHDFIVSHTYWLACMLLDMDLFWRLTENEDLDILFPERMAAYDEYPYAAHYRVPADPKWDGRIGLETGYGFADLVRHRNPHALHMAEPPEGFWQNMVCHYGGLSRNHFRPEHPAIAPRWERVRQNLAALRKA